MQNGFSPAELSLSDLIDIKEWQNIQDRFSSVTDVCLRTVDSSGKLLTSTNRIPRLCNELLRELSAKKDICGPCLPTFLGGRGVVDKNLSFTCKAGLHTLVAPLEVEGKVWGYVIIGPVVLVMRKPKDQYAEIAEELGLSLDNLWSAILEIKVLSFQGAQSLTELIKDIGEYVIRQAYLNLIKKKQVMLAPNSPKVGRLLEALLDVAFQVTGADIGSIMWINKETRRLYIRTSKGIPQEIIKNTENELGKGISGIAACEGMPLLIDSQTQDSRIRPFLNRPNLATSMITPIKVENRVLGLLNLSTLSNSQVRFNQKNLETLNKLINIATISIQP